MAAARTMIKEGISREAFRSCFAADARLRAILDDMFYGRLIRRLAIAGARYGLLDGVIELARTEPILRRALYNSVSALQPYREIVRDVLHPGLVLKLVGALGASRLGLGERSGSFS